MMLGPCRSRRLVKVQFSLFMPIVSNPIRVARNQNYQEWQVLCKYAYEEHTVFKDFGKSSRHANSENMDRETV